MKTVKQQLMELLVISILALIATGMILDGGKIMYQLAVGIGMMWVSIGVVYLMRIKAKVRIYPFEQKYLILMFLPFWLISSVLNGLLVQVNWIPMIYRIQ